MALIYNQEKWTVSHVIQRFYKDAYYRYSRRLGMSKDLEVPEGIHLVLMPPHSPELQPAERLWPLVNEPLANEAFETIAEIEELVYQRCRRLLNQKELIRGLTAYHWWPGVSAGRAA